MPVKRNGNISLILIKVILLFSVFTHSGYYNYSCASPLYSVQTELVFSERPTDLTKSLLIDNLSKSLSSVEGTTTINNSVFLYDYDGDHSSLIIDNCLASFLEFKSTLIDIQVLFCNLSSCEPNK